ncbi:M67 family metallopeptidase [Blastomonas sp. AAP53]|uniref:Mov34/MPN/PAD-1 family protein n=1 Tax=Blastomonas sp. AAP53 TaxID=1248760 RepID=UPI0003762C80|nr:M67 family metallopeptidase [Blastomonas sp. AAP53]
MPVQLSSALLVELVAQAATAHPQECCGLLIGSEQRVQTIRPCANVADDPATGFEIDPGALIAAERAMRQGGEQLIGHYHSHPNGRCEPSPRDAASAADDGRLWLIIAGQQVSVWRAVSGGALYDAFDPVPITLSDG